MTLSKNKNQKTYRKGQKFGEYTLISRLGSGGNGEVWSCISLAGETNAIKILKNVNSKPYRRFIDETIAIEKNSDIKGIIPILEKNLPKTLKDETPYFIMPIAQSSEDLLINKTIEEKIEAIIQVAECLSELHNRKIYHRDIKPANILFYDSRYSLADFGLVQYPNKKDISLKNEEIGAKWTMAPEMRRESSVADFAKADVYSLAKTLWIYLTGYKKGFDGQYSTESIIHLKKFYPTSYTTPIDNLLTECTDNDPIKRPSVNDFMYALLRWKELSENYHERNLQQWFEIQGKLFPTSIPKRVIWEDINDIVKVLKIVCMHDNLNHVFFPNHGGLDLLDVRLSHEEGCIELDFELIDIVKPKRLIFESFNYDHDWNYFRLETDELEPSGVYKVEKGEEAYNVSHMSESLTQVYPGHYEDYSYKERMSYREQENNEDVIEDIRYVTRWFRGSFVIFCKRSIYNGITSTYDGRHNEMTMDEFRNYIQEGVNHFREEENNKPSFSMLLDRSSIWRLSRRRGYENLFKEKD